MRLATLAIAAIGVLMALTAANAPTVATAVEPVVVGIDVDPSGNSPTSLGTVNDCRRVNGGEAFDIDLFVQGVQNIIAIDFTLVYDRNILRVTGVDVNQMLGANAGSGLLDKSSPLPDSDGFYGVRAVDTFTTDSSAAESGDGVLARLTLEAVGSATSGLTVEIGGVSPIMTDFDGNPITPADKFGVFTGTVLDATVSVDELCEPALPPTPTPIPTSNDTPTPTPTALPDGQPGDSGTSAGNSGTSAGGSGTSAGNSGTSAGDSGTSAGNSGTPAGDSGTPSQGQPTTPILTPGVLGAAFPSTGSGEIDDGTSGSALTFLIVGGTLVLLAASSLIWHMRHRIVK